MGPRPRIRPRLARRGGGSLLSQSEPASGQEGRLGPARSEEGGPLAPGAADSASATPLLASALAAQGAPVVSAEVALGPVGGSEAPEPVVVGSLTVDGMTYALSDDGATLVAVAPGSSGVDGPDGGRGEVGTSEPSAPSGPSEIPSIVVYGDAACDVVAIGAFAFYLSGLTEVSLPASIISVDERAFRSSDVARVEVDPANPNYASFDGALYSADLLSLLLIPEGRAGAVRIPSTAESVPPSAFSHCAGVTSIAVDAGGAAFASWDGLLYDASGATLLRVPAGATDIAIREGCTTIAAGAMEGCAKLESIEAPASVTSISPDAFASVPTVSLPALSALDDGPAGVEGEAEVSPRRVVASSQGLEAPLALPDLGSTSASPSTNTASPQLTAMVALSSGGDLAPKVDPASIMVRCELEANVQLWAEYGFDSVEVLPSAEGVLSADQERSYNPSTSTNGSYVQVASTGGGLLMIDKSNSGYQPVGSLRDRAGEWGSAGVNWSMSLAFSNQEEGLRGNVVVTCNMYDVRFHTVPSTGYRFLGFNEVDSATASITTAPSSPYTHYSGTRVMYAIFGPISYVISLDTKGGEKLDPLQATFDRTTTLPVPSRAGHRFLGWNTQEDGSGSSFAGGESEAPLNLASREGETATLYAQWERLDFDVSFEVDSEPGDEDYPGDAKDDEVINVADGTVEVENPTRPGYVFQGWVIPNADGTEAVDQELVYEEDGKWYVDASKLPDYATDGKVELTARWTSVISVDVPNSVTFYADTVTQGNESRDGLADRAFGQSKVQSQSQVDLRIVGLESQEVEGDGGSSLGASDVLVSMGASTPADSAWKLFSLYPSATELTPEELQDPDRVSAAPEGGVTFGLDDVLLEKSFSSDDFTIPAGDTLSLGYRLNLEETGISLDYGKLSELPEGGSAALANISYCFATIGRPATGSIDDGLYIVDNGKIYGPEDIEAAADDIALYGEGSVYWPQYHAYLQGGMDGANNVSGFIKWKDQDYPVRIIGICHDELSDSQKETSGGRTHAGLTFQLVDLLDELYYMNATNHNSGGWSGSAMRDGMMREARKIQVYAGIHEDLRAVAKEVKKTTHNAGGLESNAESAVSVTDDRFFLLSFVELAGDSTHPWSPDGSSFQWLLHEGTQYEFWANQGVVGTGQNAVLKKGTLSDPDTGRLWWCRTTRPAGNGSGFIAVDGTGTITYDAASQNSSGVAFAFSV